MSGEYLSAEDNERSKFMLWSGLEDDYLKGKKR